ncbi:MAG TPA: phage tail protein [Puia sp.]|nr:phage tail protein [Puia sp.]
MIPYPNIPGNLQVMPTFVPIGSVIAFAGKISPPVNAGSQPAYNTVVESQGWMVCDGRPLLQTDYGILYAVLGIEYNQAGDDSSTVFRIPDYRGYFLRMVDMESGNDPDSASRVLPNNTTSSDVGSIEQDALQYHLHPYTQPNAPASITLGTDGTTTAVPADTQNVNTAEPVADPSKSTPPPPQKPSQPPADYATIKTSFETRPKNVYVYYLIKFI